MLSSSSSSSPSVGTGDESSLFFWRWLIITDLLRSTFSEKLFLITFGGKAGPNSSELLLIFRSNCFIKSTLFEAAEPCSVGALLLFVTVALLFVSFAAIRSFIEFSSPRSFEFSELDDFVEGGDFGAQLFSSLDSSFSKIEFKNICVK